MNTFRTVSRVLVVSAVAFVGNAVAACTLFDNQPTRLLHANSATIVSSITADHFCAKNDHLKKAIMVTAGGAVGRSLTATQFGERVAVDYLVRRGSEVVNVDGLRDKVVKACDVLPAGMIRDNVNPVVQGAADVVTHPEFLTLLAMEYAIPAIVKAING